MMHAFDVLADPVRRRILEILSQGSGNHFDPVLLERFKEIAASLYEEFAHGSNQQLFRKMEGIVLKYFSKEY